jgi:hypothetical protein
MGMAVSRVVTVRMAVIMGAWFPSMTEAVGVAVVVGAGLAAVAVAVSVRV